MSRALLVLPGRGSYSGASLGSLPAGHRFVARADELRAAYDGLEPLTALDGGTGFEPDRHLRAANAAPLTFVSSLVDVEAGVGDHDVVAVVGNGLGWYSALAAAGVLSFDDAFRLVQETALLEEQPAGGEDAGGQLIYPLTDADWRLDPRLAAAVDAALDAAGADAFRSVELGGFAVLAGSEVALVRLAAALPPTEHGDRRYPLRLSHHGPYHTPLAGQVAAAAWQLLADLRWHAPSVPLVDGRGAIHSPIGADPAELAGYTLGAHVVTTYDFATSLRVALREYAPELLILPGPGSSMGGVCAQLLVAEGYRGIRSRADFEAAQTGDRPLVLAVRR